LSRGHRSNRREEGIALGELRQFSERLSVPDSVTDEAARICSMGLERGLVKRRSLAQITASSLYAACREKEVPMTLDDVATASGVGKIVVARCYRSLVLALDLKIPIADSAECLASVASRAKVDPKVEADAREMLVRAEKAEITAGVCPSALAASALYLASLLNGEWMTQSGAAEAAGVTESTVRKQSKRLRKVVEVQSGRSQPKRRFRWSELETGRSIPVEVPSPRPRLLAQ
jgi:transcription initiation factor TFIIB